MDILTSLIQSNEPSISHKAKLQLLGVSDDSFDTRLSPLIQVLLFEQDAQGKIQLHPYAKWRGAHWVLACLADLLYPSGDQSLMPLLEQVYTWLLSDYHKKHIQTINGRVRRCASLEGNALYASLALGLMDDRSQELAERLMKWQWQDGGWNCDKRPEAINSSFHESLIPFRGLALYAQRSGDSQARRTVESAADVFLKRGLYRSQKDGSVISQDFINLHYPCYWHYNILFGLKVMAEAGFIGDLRCQPALDLLESKRLSGGGFPAEGKYYRTSEKTKSGRSLVDWNGYPLPGHERANPFVTLDALHVLISAGRLAV